MLVADAGGRAEVLIAHRRPVVQNHPAPEIFSPPPRPFSTSFLHSPPQNTSTKSTASLFTGISVHNNARACYNDALQKSHITLAHSPSTHRANSPSTVPAQLPPALTIPIAPRQRLQARCCQNN